MGIYLLFLGGLRNWLNLTFNGGAWSQHLAEV